MLLQLSLPGFSNLLYLPEGCYKGLHVVGYAQLIIGNVFRFNVLFNIRHNLLNFIRVTYCVIRVHSILL